VIVLPRRWETATLPLTSLGHPIDRPTGEGPSSKQAGEMQSSGSNITNHRLVDFDGEQVRFLWRDYEHASTQKIMSLTGDEFVRRFLLHTLPRGLARIRHFGLLANRFRHDKLSHCRTLLDQPKLEPTEVESADVRMLRLTGVDITRCP
jgi:hypothetical protein